MTALTEKRAELDAKRSQLMAIFDEIQAGTKQATPELRAEIKNRNGELDTLHDEVTSLAEMDEVERKTREAIKAAATPAQAMTFPGGHQDGQSQPEAKRQGPPNIGRMLTDSEEYKSARGKTARINVEFPHADLTAAFKTTMTTTAGFAPYPQLTNIVVPLAQRRPMVPDLIPQDTTTQPSILYMEETTNTNNAAPVAEGGSKPESALAFTRRTVPVEVIATFLPVSRQQIDDVPQIEALINNRLTLMIQLVEEDQILNGNGTSPNLVGFYNKSGLQTQAKGADPSPSAILKAITKVQAVGFADPTAIVLHTTDWQNIQLLQDSTGRYIWGSPADPNPKRIWGLPVVATPEATLGTALTGDFVMYSHISRRMGIQIDISDSHQDFFIKNLLAIRAEERVALEIYRPSAFALISGL